MIYNDDCKGSCSCHGHDDGAGLMMMVTYNNDCNGNDGHHDGDDA